MDSELKIYSGRKIKLRISIKPFSCHFWEFFFFILFTFVLTLVEGIAGIILPILHGVIITTLVYWYWKKKTIEANQKEDVQST